MAASSLFPEETMATQFSQTGSPPGFGRSPERSGPSSSKAAPPSRPSHRHYARRRDIPNLGAASLAQGLGWFSIALGAAAVLAPRTLGSLAGVGRGTGSLMRSIGIRELANGVGILNQRNPAPWLWSRVVGDVVDLAVLATGLRADNPGRGRAAFSFAAVAGILALDTLAASHLTKHAGHPLVSGVAAPTDLYFETSIATGKTPEECYRFWRNIENLPRFMAGLQSVQALDERRFHWVARGTDETPLEWDCEITEDRPGAALAWRTLNGAAVPNAGSVIFEPVPHGRGTIVRLSIHYSPVDGQLTGALAKLLRQDPQSKVHEDLRRFKQLLENGEIATTNGQPTGRRSFIGRAARRWRLTDSN
jgi:uncharacterized membrane protein